MNPTHIALAVAIAVVGTIAYSLGMATQHRSVAGQPEGVGLKQFLTLFTNPRWLLGMVGIGVSAACHFVALTMAPINVVQPIGILAIIWSVLLEDRRRQKRSSGRLWAIVITSALALGAFVLATGTHAVAPKDLTIPALLMAVVPILALAALLAVIGVATKKMWLKTLLCAASAACAYGLATGLIKTALIALGRYGWGSLWVWGCVAGLLVLYPVAAWVLQQSFGAGAASVGVGVMTTTDPVMAVTFGLIALGEGAGLSARTGVLMVISGIVAISGIVWLSKLREDVVD